MKAKASKAECARRRKAEAERYRLAPTCQTCGLAWKDHAVCSACGIAAGPGHETLVKEPHGKHQVCGSCWRALRDNQQYVAKPMLAKSYGFVRALDRPDAPALEVPEKPVLGAIRLC